MEGTPPVEKVNELLARVTLYSLFGMDGLLTDGSAKFLMKMARFLKKRSCFWIKIVTNGADL